MKTLRIFLPGLVLFIAAGLAVARKSSTAGMAVWLVLGFIVLVIAGCMLLMVMFERSGIARLVARRGAQAGCRGQLGSGWESSSGFLLVESSELLWMPAKAPMSGSILPSPSSETPTLVFRPGSTTSVRVVKVEVGLTRRTGVEVVTPEGATTFGIVFGSADTFLGALDSAGFAVQR